MKTQSQVINVSDCWNRIGVWRKGQDICPELSNVAHCRNCQVYIEAGLTLLDREISDEYIEENSVKYKEAKSQDVDTDVSCIVFRSGTEWYAISSKFLNEICEVGDIHSIPHNRNPLISGMVNIRGEIEICLAFHEINIQNLHKLEQTSNARMLVINLDSGKYVYRADEVMGIFKISQNHLRQTPSSISADKSHFVTMIFDYNEQTVGLIDPCLMDSRVRDV